MTNLTTNTVELLKLIHRGHARLRATPKDTARYAELKELIDCTVSVFVLYMRDETFTPLPRQQQLFEQLNDATRLTLGDR